MQSENLDQKINTVKFVQWRKKFMAKETIEEETAKEKRRTDENVIYVGKKPPMSYVLAVVTQFQSSGLLFYPSQNI